MNAEHADEIRDCIIAKTHSGDSDKRLIAILDSITDGIVGVGFDWRYTYANESAARALRKRKEQLIGEHVFRAFPEAKGTVFERYFRRALEERVPVSFEAFYEPLSSWFECRCYPSPEGISVLFTDTTERNRQEQALRKSEERFRALAEASSEVLYRMSPDWKEMCLLHSQGSLPNTEDPSSTWLQDYIPADEQAQVMAAINEAIRNKSVFELEHRVLRSDGTVAWTFSRAVPLLDAKGEIVEWFGAARDITERKQAEKALKEAHDRAVCLGRFPEENPNPVLRVSVEGIVLYCNPAAARIRGWACEVGQILQKELLPLLGHAVAEEGEVQQDVELDGRIYIIWIEPIRGEGYVNVYGRDITAHKWAESERERLLAEVRAEKEKLSALVASIQDEVWFADTEKRFTLANPTALREFGLGSGAVVDVEKLAARLRVLRPDGSLRPVEEAPPLRALKGEVVSNQEEMIQTPARGEVRYRQVSSAPVRDEHGNIIGSVSVVRDITEAKRMEQELRRSRNELERRVRARTAELELKNKELQDFAFVASHDLQEPLRKVQTFGNMLIAKCGVSLDEISRDYINRMQKATTRMQDLLSSLLSYSRVSTKAEPIKETDLRKSVESALSNLEIMIRETNARVEAGDLPTVTADRVQMIQLFQNLIGNALKFHREGEAPHVKIHSKEVGDACEIYVEDNGTGFEEKYLDKIFLPFHTLHGRSSGYEGVGMGLAICRKIVERHGGKITARSEPGKGSTFVVTLPAKGRRNT